MNTFAYAPNPISWIDVVGLSKTCELKNRGGLDWKSIVNRGETRKDHILDGHYYINPAKPIQTLFNKDPISLINKAWQKRMRSDPCPDSSSIGDRDIYIIDTHKTIGYNRDSKVETTSKIKIVVERNTNKLVTAFPYFSHLDQ